MPQPRQVTVNDIIHSDERVIQLKKTYQELQNEKNGLIIDISNIEAHIIAKMGVFEYLNEFADVADEQKGLLPTFRSLIGKKKHLIDEIKAKDEAMENTTKSYEKIAQEIVADLQKQFGKPQSAESCETCPETAPEDAHECDGNCDQCQCPHNNAENPADV